MFKPETDMLPDTATDWIAYLLITISVGALGTALWEFVLRPGAVKLGQRMLSYFIGIFHSLSERIYIDIAAKMVDRPVLFPIGRTSFLFIIISSFALGVYVYPKSDLKTLEEKVSQMPLEELRADLTELEKDVGDPVKEVALLIFTVGLIGFVWNGFVYVRNTYVIFAIRLFDQCMAICAPFMDELGQKEIISKFALIKNESDYVALLGRLNKIAVDHDVELPNIDILLRVK